MTPRRSAVLLARLRADGAVPAADAVAAGLADEAAAVGRRLTRIGPTVRLGWADGHEPDPDGAPTSRLSTFPTGVLAAVLALAWPDPSVDPYPGEPLPTGAVEELARILDRDPKVVSKYIAELRATDLLADDADGRLRLGRP